MNHIKVKTPLLWGAFITLFGIIIFTCWWSRTVTKHTGRPQRVKIGLTMATLQEERWKRDLEYLSEKISELGGELISLSANNNPQVQLEQAQYFVDKKVNVLIIIPQDLNQAANAVEVAKRAGVKVISYDRLIRNADLDLYISFDNMKVGELVAERLIKEVPFGNYVIINGAPTDNNGYLVNQGYKNVLTPFLARGDIKIVYEAWAENWQPEKAYEYTSRLLLDGVDFDAVIAANDGLASGVIEALSEWRLAGKIPVTGHDADLSGCQRIIEGTQLMTVYKPIRKLAYRTAELAMLLAADKEVETNHQAVFNGKYTVPTEIITPVSIDRFNMNLIFEDGFHRPADIYLNIPNKTGQF